MRECDALLAAGRKARPRLSEWVNEHYHEAAQSIIDMFAGSGHTITGMRAADVGCGDGLVDLGLAHKARPREVVGYDMEPTPVPHLLPIPRLPRPPPRLP